MLNIEQLYILNPDIFEKKSTDPKIIKKFASTFAYTRAGIDFIRNISCPHGLALTVYLSTFDIGTTFTHKQLMNQFYEDSKGNAMFLEYTLQRMIDLEILITNK